MYAKARRFALNVLEPMLIKPPTPNYIDFQLSQEEKSSTISHEMVDRYSCCVFIFILKSADRECLADPVTEACES